MASVEQFKSLPLQVSTVIDVQCLGETLGRKLWPSEYSEVIDYLFKDDSKAREICKAAADVTCEAKLLEMEEEYEYSRSLISA